MTTPKCCAGSRTTEMPTKHLRKTDALGTLVGLLTLLFGLTSCIELAPGMSPALSSPTVATSPLGGPTPDTTLSPLNTPTTGRALSPLPTPTPEKVASGPAPAIDADFDLAQAALTPNDMTDLFQASYSIQQEYRRPGMRGVQVLYPTDIVPHTTGFAAGFETRLEAYDQATSAHEAFSAATADDGGKVLEVPPVGEQSRVVVTASNARNEDVPLDDSGATRFTYKVIVREANVLMRITIKTPISLSTERLEQIMKSVVGRLSATGS